jgi:thiol:disulfide interchange protein DsbG
MMNKFKLLSALFIAAALVGCGKQESSGAAASSAKAQAPAASIETLQAEGTGFTVGSTMSVRTVYVFFDAQCPHCGSLWYAAKPLTKQAKFVWIPVRLLNDNSEGQGATMLAAKDPVAAMDEHEASLMDKKGGMSTSGDIAAQRAQVKKNTELFNKFGFASVPTIVFKNAQTGALVTREGGLPTAELAAFLGLQAPSGQ